MPQKANKITEHRRFPFWGTLFAGVFLLFIIRVYWDPLFAKNVIRMDQQNNWETNQYPVWGPIWEYGFVRMGKGEIPYWNPYQLCGQPYLVDIRTALFQPLHLLFWRMEFAHAYQWYIFCSLFLLGMAFLLWGRILEIPYSALIPALISLLFSGPVICIQMSLPFLSGSVWLLFLLSGIVYFLEETHLRSFLVLLFIWVALILSGSIECVLAGLLVLLLFPFALPFFPSINTSRNPVALIPQIGIVLILGIIITSFTWLPFLIWLLYSGENWEQFSSFPLSAHFPDTWTTLLYHIFIPFRFPGLPELPVIYPGVICCIFMIPAFFDRELRPVVLFHSFLLLLFLFSYFINIPFVRELQRGMLILVAVSFAILAGIGLYRLLLKGRDISSPYVWASGLLVYLSLLVLILIGTPWIKGICILLLILLTPAIIIRIPRINIIFCLLIALLSFIELFYQLRPFLPESYISAIEGKNAFSESIRQLRYQTGTGKALIVSDPSSPLWSENIGMLYHWQLVNGISIPKDTYTNLWINSIFNPPKKITEQLLNPFVNMSGVQWAFIPLNPEEKNHDKELSHWRRAETLSTVDAFENTQPIPRCYWIAQYKVATTPDEMMDLLLHNEFSPYSECIVQMDSTLSKETKIPFTSAKDVQEISNKLVTATIQEETPEFISIQAKAPYEGFLILLDTFSPGWNAFVDGQLVPIYRANGIFRGVLIPEGNHQITFVYRCPGWNAGKMVSLIGLILTLCIVLVKQFSRARNSTNQND